MSSYYYCCVDILHIRPARRPRRWLGLFLDFGQLKAVNNDTGTEYQTSKIGCVQNDYQFTLGDSFSLLGTEFSGKGVLPDNTKYEYYKADLIGA